MAEKKPEAAAEGEAPKGKSKMLLFGGIGLVALIVIAVAVYFLFLKKPPVDPDAEEGDQPVAEEKHGKKKDSKKKDAHAGPPAFYKFDKPFTVKLQAAEGGQDAYLQAEVQLKISDPHGADALKAYDPELKHKLTLTLMTKKVTDVTSAAGVERLAYEMRDVVNAVLEPPDPKKKKSASAEPQEHADPDAQVQAVLFTTFIVQ